MNNNYVVAKYQVFLGMNEWKNIDFYGMVKLRNKIRLF
jgi:hypothetical protein